MIFDRFGPAMFVTALLAVGLDRWSARFSCATQQAAATAGASSSSNEQFSQKLITGFVLTAGDSRHAGACRHVAAGHGCA